MRDAVLSTRVAARELAEIARAAGRRGVPVSQFAREAALLAAARVNERVVSPNASAAAAVSVEDADDVFVVGRGDPGQRVHYVDGEPVVR